MTYRELRQQAHGEWRSSERIRRRYPTFTHYWRVRYTRVYRPYGWRTRLVLRLLHLLHLRPG